MTNKTAYQLLLMSLFSLTLIACGGSKETETHSKKDRKATITKSLGLNKTGKMVTFYEDQFSILKPKKWRMMNDLNEEADLQMGNVRKEAYAIVLTESKMDFEDASLQDYSDLTRGFLSENLKKHEESAPEKLTINGYPAIKYSITGNIDFIKLKYWHVSIEAGDHFHQIVMWSLNSKFEKNQATYNKVIQSFKAN